jgi:hypothetical protein
MNKQYLVADDQFNRAWYKSEVGKIITYPMPYARLYDVDRPCARIDWHYVKPGNTEQERAAMRHLTFDNGIFDDMGSIENWNAYLAEYKPIS